MKWEDTVASGCRYAHCLEQILGDKEIIWESSVCDWQGSVDILADMKDGTFFSYSYCYGSCSGCDTWESAGWDSDRIIEEMKKTAAILDKDSMIRYISECNDDDRAKTFRVYIGEEER